MKAFVQSKIELNKLANNIKLARKRSKMTVTELSIKSDVSRNVIARIEKGCDAVGIGKVFNVLDALGLLRGLSDVVHPEMDRSQALYEIKQLREERYQVNEPNINNRFIREFE